MIGVPFLVTELVAFLQHGWALFPFSLRVPSYEVSVAKIRSIQDPKERQEREKQNPFFAAPDRNRLSKTDCTVCFCESTAHFVARECSNGPELLSLFELRKQSEAIHPPLFGV